GADGSYAFSGLDCGTKYFVRASADTFETKEKDIVTPEEDGKVRLDFVLDPLFKDKVDLAKLYDIENIYFAFDKWDITPRAEEKLNILLKVLNDHPTISIAIGSHTDSRANDRYNEVLSDKRAKSTMDWLIGKGIDANRMTAKGYGEYRLVNRCSNGVKCSKEEHQANRRREFVILK
ncbi:MAG: OmpA family protein, partial [Aestuariibaculum sp.]